MLLLITVCETLVLPLFVIDSLLGDGILKSAPLSTAVSLFSRLFRSDGGGGGVVVGDRISPLVALWSSLLLVPDDELLVDAGWCC